MQCPNKHNHLEKVLFHNVEVDYCPECLGIWFEKNELRWAKDDKDEQLNWLDFDIWRDKGRFQLSKSDRHCPVDRSGLVRVNYDDSNVHPVKFREAEISSKEKLFGGVKIDFCKMCQGIWLDRGEFNQIMIYLKKKADYEILHRYTKNLALQLWEVFAGPKKFREELFDFLMLVKLLNYKFVVQHPFLNSLIENSQK